VLHIRQSGSDLERHSNWGIQRDLSEGGHASDSYPDSVNMLRAGRPNRMNSSGCLLFREDSLPDLTSDLHDLAQWAFGPVGFPALRLIAVGDFSGNGRYLSDSVLLCRHTESVRPSQQTGTGQNFRRLAKRDVSLLGLGENFTSFLEACPTDPPFVEL
jgi:hypothetical protein